VSEENLILKELKGVVLGVGKKKTAMFVDEIVNAKSIKIIGYGRSGYVGQCFSMRLKHLGLKSGQDLVIVISGSGKIKEKIGGKKKSVLITMNKNCALAKKVDLVIELKAKKSKQPMRSLFEQSALVYLDGVIMKLMKKLKVNEKEMWKRHD